MTPRDIEKKEPSAAGSVAGFAAILGLPNVGKSTLLNQILGQKVAIVSPKPQTTRDRILGVHTTEAGQIVFLDTPGVHKSDKPLNEYMVAQALSTIADADAVILVVDADAAIGGKDEAGAAAIEDDLARRAADKGAPLLVALNKIDKVAEKVKLLPLMDRWKASAAVVPISAATGDGVDLLVREIWPHLPVGPAYFEGDALTDRSVRWLAGEAIREQVFLLTRAEVPYACAVGVERWEERAATQDVYVEAVIFVERDSQKGIVVGKGGLMVKQIGTAAREAISALVGRPVHLKLRVMVENAWARSLKGLRRVGYEP
jgi:GTP-binding protein Era